MLKGEADQAAKENVERLKHEAELWKARADAAVANAEFAYEVIRAILPELRRGKPVTKPSLLNAWHRLENVPDKMKAILMPYDGPLDVELRKEEP